ncbi:MAG: hypothetical protein A3F13_06625 [Gammaproteobacteria bacterium RIFCSPHIGHO2_12_FULL_40_19]|nr:MAG: hypothetical protein A3F13_06625 [Gammaproteobacteria bacterium RIFCSPHIGHO2_12_FULL_40_19]
MVLSEDHSDAQFQINAISSGKIGINKESYTHSLIIAPHKLITNWKPTTVGAITDDDLLMLLVDHPEIILLGTGERSIILPAKKLAVLLEKQHHIECMNTASACRTYTILAAEGRKVVAGLII